MDRNLLTGVLIIAVIGLAVTVPYLQSRHDKRRIREYLLENHASNITVSGLGTSFIVAWAGIAVYDVRYADQKGNHCATSCIARNFPGGTELYWRDPTEI